MLFNLTSELIGNHLLAAMFGVSEFANTAAASKVGMEMVVKSLETWVNLS